MSSKTLLAKLQDAGLNVKAAASAVDEQAVLRVLNGGGNGAPAQEPQASSPRRPRPGPRPSPTARARRPSSRSRSSPSSEPRSGARGPGRPAAGPQQGRPQRPTRSGLQGERAPASSGGRRRVIIDSQASRRQQGGPAPAPSRPPRRRGGRRRRGTYQEPAPRVAPTDPSKVLVRDPVGLDGQGRRRVPRRAGPRGHQEAHDPGRDGHADQDAHRRRHHRPRRGVQQDRSRSRMPPTRSVEEDTFEDADEDLADRPPVVTIMGHVDHGKTSLLDAVRSTEVAAGEAGGITQHIGAYQVHHNDKVVTFLDTPGHEAFTAMRARGADVTDLAVIVVAADDGVKPQTQEAIDHARAADVPMVVAVNKIDKEGAQPDRVRGEMAQRGAQPGRMGRRHRVRRRLGQDRKVGLEDLLDTIQVVAELEELKANPDAEASGAVIESKLDPGRGPVVTILIGRGTLHVGDARGRRRALGPRARDARLHRRAHQGRQPGRAGRGARLRRRARGGRARARGRERAPRAPARHRARPAAEDRGAGPPLGHQGLARGRAHAVARGPGQGAQPRRQGRRVGLAGGGRGRDRAPAAVRGRRSTSSTAASAASTSPTSCWPRPPTASSSASTCGRARTPAPRPSARAWRSAPTRSSTGRSRTSRRPWRACSSPRRWRPPSGEAQVLQVFKASRVGAIAGC